MKRPKWKRHGSFWLCGSNIRASHLHPGHPPAEFPKPSLSPSTTPRPPGVALTRLAYPMGERGKYHYKTPRYRSTDHLWCCYLIYFMFMSFLPLEPQQAVKMLCSQVDHKCANRVAHSYLKLRSFEEDECSNLKMLLPQIHSIRAYLLNACHFKLVTKQGFFCREKGSRERGDFSLVKIPDCAILCTLSTIVKS